MTTLVRQADYHDPGDAQALAFLLQSYAMDPMGGGQPMAQAKLDRLAGELARRPHAFSVLAFVDGAPAGLANCFEAFSTFACAPLVNIHDIVVVEAHRGRGLSRLLLGEVERIARSRDCCKLTLEVLEGNAVARAAYERLGFGDYVLDPAVGRALFWQKKLCQV